MVNAWLILGKLPRCRQIGKIIGRVVLLASFDRSTASDNGSIMDISTIIFIFFALMALQPLLMGRCYAVRRAQAIKSLEKKNKSRVITMIHRQEKRSLLGMNVARHIYLEDAQTIIAAIKGTPPDKPIDLIAFQMVLGAMTPAEAARMVMEKPTAYVEAAEKAVIASASRKKPAAAAKSALRPIARRASTNARRLRRKKP